MAPKSKPTGYDQYCSVEQFVKVIDPELYSAYDNMCLRGALRVHSGLVFLFPKEAAYREKIEGLVGKDSPQAEVLLKSLVIPLHLPTGEDWMRQDVGSLNGVKYKVQSGSGNKVVLAGEGKETVTLERSTEFVQDKKYDTVGKVSVWNIVSGHLPTSGEKYERPLKKAGAAAKHGGGESAPAKRALLASQLEQAFASAGGQVCVWLPKVCGLLAHLSAKQPALFAALQPLIDCDPGVTFYLLVEPYKVSGALMIPDAVLFGPDGWNGADGFGDCKALYKSFWAKTEMKSAVSRIDAVRLKMFGVDGSEAGRTRTPKEAKEAYETLMTANTIDGAGPILPAATIALVGSGAKKAWQDEMRFIIHGALQELMADFDLTEFKNLVSTLRAERAGNDYNKESSIYNSPLLGKNVAPNADFAFLTKLINSTDFLYICCAESAVGKPRGDASNPTDLTVYNRNASALSALNKCAAPVRANISDTTLAELRAYAQQFGSLPPEVLQLVKS